MKKSKNVKFAALMLFVCAVLFLVLCQEKVQIKYNQFSLFM